MAGGYVDVESCSPATTIWEDADDIGCTKSWCSGYVAMSRQPRGTVRRTFRAYYWPICLGLVMEVVMCLTMGVWSDKNEALGMGVDNNWLVLDEANLKEWYWSVFFGCLLMRLLSVLLWKLQFGHMKDSTYAAMYMFFSCAQWVFYLAAYYWLYDELTALAWKPEVQVKYNKKHFDPLTPEGYRKVHDMTISACLQTFDPLTCRNLTSQQVECSMPFQNELCSGWTWVGSKTMGEVKCCVRNRYSLSPPDTSVPFTPFDMHALFPAFQWLATLVMGWMMHDTPMLPASSHYSTFMNGLFLDILDAVLFGDYLLNKKVMYPAYGIDPGTGYAGPEDKALALTLWRTWLLAIGTACLSPVLYTLMRREHAFEPRKENGVTVDDGLKDLVQNIRLLDRDSAVGDVEKVIALQKAQYISVSNSDDVHPVVVHEEEPSMFRGPGRRGKAQLDCQQPGLYRVTYDSDDEEAIVGVDHIEPVMEEHERMCGPKCCWGWFDFRGCSRDRFERWALVLDSCRSLFFLELPFFLWRLQLDGRDLGSNTISLLMLKNLVWGITDLLTILACGNENATCFAGRPIRWVTDHINGTILAFIWVGPGGFFRIVADAVVKTSQDRIAEQKHKVTVHKAWLILEREKAVESGAKASTETFDAEIERLDAKLADLDKESQLTHI